MEDVETMVETKIIVREGFEEIYNSAKGKLEVLENDARVREELAILEIKEKIANEISEDKKALEAIIESATMTVEVEVEEPVEEQVVESTEIVEENNDGNNEDGVVGE